MLLCLLPTFIVMCHLQLFASTAHSAINASLVFSQGFSYKWAVSSRLHISHIRWFTTPVLFLYSHHNICKLRRTIFTSPLLVQFFLDSCFTFSILLFSSKRLMQREDIIIIRRSRMMRITCDGHKTMTARLFSSTDIRRPKRTVHVAPARLGDTLGYARLDRVNSRLYYTMAGKIVLMQMY